MDDIALLRRMYETVYKGAEEAETLLIEKGDANTAIEILQRALMRAVLLRKFGIEAVDELVKYMESKD